LKDATKLRHILQTTKQIPHIFFTIRSTFGRLPLGDERKRLPEKKARTFSHHHHPYI